LGCEPNGPQKHSEEQAVKLEGLIMFGVSTKEMFKMAMITVGVMFVANQLAAMNPTMRRLLKGVTLSPVTTPDTRVEQPRTVVV